MNRLMLDDGWVDAWMLDGWMNSGCVDRFWLMDRGMDECWMVDGWSGWIVNVWIDFG